MAGCPGGNVGLRWRRGEIQRFEEGNKGRLLLFNQTGVTGHFEKPSHVVTVLNHTQNTFRVTTARVLAGDVVELRRLAGGFDIFRGFFQFVRRHGRQADLAAPAVDVGFVAPGQAGQGNDTDVGLFTVRAGHFERCHAHFARRNLGPAVRRFPGQLRQGGCRCRRQRGRRCGRDVRMSRRQRRVGRIGGQGGRGLLLWLVLILGDAIDLDFVAVATGHEQNSNGDQDPAAAKAG